MKGWGAAARGMMCRGLLACVSVLVIVTSPSSSAWGNGGRSADPANPDYGAHDWIAERAANLLPENESSFMLDSRARYLFGTEIPDFVIEDQKEHHVYFHPDGEIMEDNSARRAREEYGSLVDLLRSGDRPLAAEKAGVMSHYIVDVAVFGHVLSSKTVWGEEKHHADFEDDADVMMAPGGDPKQGVVFDGTLGSLAAYDATVRIARDTTFGDGVHTARWLDDHYAPGLASWSPEFRAEILRLVDVAANLLADVLHSAVLEANATAPPEPASATRPSEQQLLLLGLFIGALIAILVTLLLSGRGRRGRR